MRYALDFAAARLAGAFLAELIALLVAATLIVFPTGFLAAGFLFAGASLAVLAAPPREEVEVLRAGLAGTASVLA